MTTINEARAAAYQRFIAEWVTTDDPPAALTPFCFDNEPFEPPVDDEQRVLPWARVSVRNITSGFSTMGAPGNRKVSRRALVRVEVYTRPGSGQRDADELCQKALDMFEGRYLAGVLTYDGQIAEAGLVDDGRWNLSTAQTTFDYEQIK